MANSNITLLLVSLVAFTVIVPSFTMGVTEANHDDQNDLIHKYHVQINADMPAGSPQVVVHCKSGDDDLGIHDLSNGDEYDFSFRVNLFHRTLFYCHVSCGPKETWFHAFQASRDEVACDLYKTCYWAVRANGIFFSNNDLQWINLYPW